MTNDGVLSASLVALNETSANEIAWQQHQPAVLATEVPVALLVGRWIRQGVVLGARFCLAMLSTSARPAAAARLAMCNDAHGSCDVCPRWLSILTVRSVSLT